MVFGRGLFLAVQRATAQSLPITVSERPGITLGEKVVFKGFSCDFQSGNRMFSTVYVIGIP